MKRYLVEYVALDGTFCTDGFYADDCKDAVMQLRTKVTPLFIRRCYRVW